MRFTIAALAFSALAASYPTAGVVKDMQAIYESAQPLQRPTSGVIRELESIYENAQLYMGDVEIIEGEGGVEHADD